MSNQSYLELEQEIEKMARAMLTRNRQIGNDLVANLRVQLPLEGVAGVMLVSLERIIWFDVDSFVWTIKHLVPPDVLQEIQRITSVTLYRQLISKGLIPGLDYSVDADSKLLLNSKARAVFTHEP